VPPARLIIVGAVHIAQSLAPMAAMLDFDVTVVDPRGAWATTNRFPGVKVVQDWADEAFETMGLDVSTAVVTLTHDPKLDDPALEAALKSEAFYVGALGSRRTHAKRKERLAEAGITEEQFNRIHGPVEADADEDLPADTERMQVVCEPVRAPVELAVRNRLTAVEEGGRLGCLRRPLLEELRDAPARGVFVFGVVPCAELVHVLVRQERQL